VAETPHSPNHSLVLKENTVKTLKDVISSILTQRVAGKDSYGEWTIFWVRRPEGGYYQVIVTETGYMFPAAVVMKASYGWWKGYLFEIAEQESGVSCEIIPFASETMTTFRPQGKTRKLVGEVIACDYQSFFETEDRKVEVDKEVERIKRAVANPKARVVFGKPEKMGARDTKPRKDGVSASHILKETGQRAIPKPSPSEVRAAIAGKPDYLRKAEAEADRLIKEFGTK